MKPSHTKTLIATLLALAGSLTVQSQSNNVPGPSDYNRFSQFIADRNIFDPNRQPRYNPGRIIRTTRPRPTRGTPYIALVGTMNYDKGIFAFFDSNDSGMKRIIPAGEQYAGYTVKAVTSDSITLVDKNKKELAMKIGSQMHQDGSAWVLSSANDYSAPTDSSSSGGESSSSSSESSSAPAPSPNLENNDVLKRLMQLREKENQ